MNRLPPEIISHIAQHVLQPYDDTARIVPLTHVCQYWRNTIISAPEHWTSIIYYRPNLAKLSLERSKAAPLQLQLIGTFISQGRGLHDLIMPYIQNIETLRFEELTAIEDLTRIFPNFPQSMPNLRSLDLGHWYDQPGWDPSIDPFGSFPNTLRSLSLNNIPIYPSLLRLRTLTKLTLCFYTVYPPSNLLDFLGDNRSLKHLDIAINSEALPVHILQRRAIVMDQLQYLSISSDVADAKTLVSSVPLRRGAKLDISFHGSHTGLGDILSGISLTHLLNLPSPTFMEYQSSPQVARLTGPNGSFSYNHKWHSGIAFTEFPVLPLTDIRELRLTHSDPSTVFHPSSFPALETLTIQCDTDISRLFSALFPNPSSFPSLKTLGFLDCDVTDKFMKELTRFASGRKSTTSARLHRVVFVGPQHGELPAAASIRKLEKHVPIVEVQFGRMLTTNVI